MINCIKPRKPLTRNLQKYQEKPFGSTDLYMNNITLDSYIEFGKEADHDSFALIRNGEISTVMAVKISDLGTVMDYPRDKISIHENCKKLGEDEKCLFIEFLNRNSECSSITKGDGRIMINWLKKQSKKMNINIISLEADGVNPMKLASNYYQSELGFVRCSDIYQTDGWPGELIFMVCDLSQNFIPPS